MYFTDHKLYSKLCHFSTLDICSQFMWQLLVHKGIPLCNPSESPLFFYFRVFKYFMDEKQDCKIIACENSIFLYGGTLSWIIERVKSARNGEEKNLLSLLQTALFLCQNKWMIKVFYLIYLALKELRLVMSIVIDDWLNNTVAQNITLLQFQGKRIVSKKSLYVVVFFKPYQCSHTETNPF